MFSNMSRRSLPRPVPIQNPLRPSSHCPPIAASRMPSATSPAIVTKNHAAGAVADCQRQSGVVTVKSSTPLLCGNRTDGYWNVADVRAAGRFDEERIAPVFTRLGIERESVALGRKKFEARLLGDGQFCGNANGCYSYSFCRILIKAKPPRSSRQARQMLDPADHAANNRNIAV